jgi:hypothetical protein
MTRFVLFLPSLVLPYTPDSTKLLTFDLRITI